MPAVQPAVSRLRNLIGIAIAYFLCGKLALLLAIPPGYASIVWPAAGVALGAVLLFGPGCWLAIFIGSYLVNLATGWDASGLTSLFASVLLPAGLAGGASLQAVFSAFLIRRLVGFPLSFHQIHLVIKVVLLSALGCLVGATVGVLCLYVSGTLPAAALASNWLTWWSGDFFGVLIILPMLLTWNQNLARSGSLPLTTVLLPLLVTLLLIFILFFNVRSSETEKERLLFANRAAQLGVAFEDRLQSYLDDLYSIEGLFRASKKVERQEFADFVTNILARHQGIQALEWIPRVMAADRLKLEAAAKRDGFPDFRIRELNQQRQMVPAAGRERYYPVYYLEPYRGNENALGFDLGSNPVRLEVLQRARDLAKAVTSGRITLVQDTAEQVGVLIILPLYADGRAPQSVIERRQNLAGYALGVFRVGDMLNAAFADYDRWGLSHALYDRTAKDVQQLLYRGDDLTDANEPHQRISHLLRHSVPIEFGTRKWELSFTPTDRYLNQMRFNESRAVLISGLLFFGLLGGLLLVSAGRNALVRRLVEEQTASLADANAALRESETQQRAIVENAVDGIASIDEQGTLLTFNTAAEQIFGYPAEEVIGQNVKILQPEPYRSQHDGYLQRYLKSGEPHIIGIGREVSGRRRDGTVFPLDLSVSEVRLEKGRQFIGLLRDITDRKQSEERLQQANEKLQEVDRLKSMFIASMSHELRTPLNAIIGFTSILHEEWLGALNAEQKENLAIVSRSGKHLLALINDVIDISKIEGGKLDVHVDSFDLHQVIEEAVNNLAAQAETQRLELRVVNLHQQIHTDRLRLLQCLLNLLSNAIKYTERGWVEVAVTLLDGESEAIPQVKIEVRDSGIGISQVDQALLFKPFVRLETALKSQILGTGLGLFLCRKLAMDVLHGSLECSSEPGVGSCFTLTIPTCVEVA